MTCVTAVLAFNLKFYNFGKYFSIFIFFLFTIWRVSFAGEAINQVKRTKFPMLYFDPEDVPKLLVKARTTHQKIANIITEAGKSFKETPDHYLPPKSHEKFPSS